MNIETLAPVIAAWAKMQATSASLANESKQSFNTIFLLALLAQMEPDRSLTPAGPTTAAGRLADGSQVDRTGAPAPSNTSLETLISEVAARYGLPASLLKGVVAAESGFNPGAVSPAGAIGLMQLMPATARALGVNNPFDPAANLDGGARYLKQMLDRFQGNIRMALAAYNAGPGAVEHYRGVPPYRETRAYIDKVLTAARKFESLV
ncbi:Membrane-bound lytic murein transglycosylase F [Moorella thermoacetica]|uniref:Membrane-bound lytic murein transglycosylase F n=1 Tax=Neomoorella thermoacetica TaxID=1525 RepID=A0A1D7XBP1_NEOTH|nr:lytic transglycosylase domain-containing protein [Moorella thermoacetica]AOQ24339.1 Soluble lytic murein transglycosylase precursor [Moorella thermoacetica]OIQ07926.1 soluble lytic murein transglycosylase precursor [Moorella thermoacetica]OIQ10919.1 soluble lytic murein transglycosylase precursor [Moorella thermoacetica]OIQ60281.1 soluble lytic murein transglycosylase precursor [Moorella thermoacetica]TYL14746.1 Membrane-bound lytic murein transglycosylase F [Moorella thermoacetica]